MNVIADVLLVAGALGAAFYCFVLGRRLRRFNDLEKGVGGAVAVLSSQVDELSRTLREAREKSQLANDDLQKLTQKADSVAQRLELIMASMHDMPNEADPGSETQRPPVGLGMCSGVSSADQPGLMFMRHDRSNEEVGG